MRRRWRLDVVELVDFGVPRRLAAVDAAGRGRYEPGQALDRPRHGRDARVAIRESRQGGNASSMMKWQSIAAALAFSVAAACLALAAPANAAKRVALVVGNNEYRNVP